MYCKTLNVSLPFISRAKQNCEIKGREYQLSAKIGRDYNSISSCMVLIRKNKIKGAKIILHPTFRAAKFKGFTVCRVVNYKTAVYKMPVSAAVIANSGLDK